MEQDSLIGGIQQPSRILVVDDNAKNRYMLEVLLKANGYDVVSAQDGIEALRILRAEPFDGIISDILMPVMDGFQLIRECKKDPALKNIPFIFYTATYTEKKDEDFGLSLGAIRYIVKPSEPNDLIREIQEAFAGHAKRPRDFDRYPPPGDGEFACGYAERVGEKLEMKERELAESEEKFRLVYENSMDAILLTTPDGGIQAANPAACEMFQQTEAEIIEKGRNLIIDPADPRLPDALEERQRTGRFKGELTLLRRDGTKFPGEVTSHIFTDQNGKTRTSMIIRDITLRKNMEIALKESEEMYRTLVETAREAIMVAQDGVFRYVNPALGELIGYRAEDLISRPIAGFIHPEDRDRVYDNYRRRIAGETFPNRYAFRAVDREGKTIWVEITATRIAWKGKPATLNFFTDITERRAAEEKLRQFNENLEKQVAERTDQLNRSLHEKELLLREIHHRVKNNLQIVASLLNLQSRQISDPATLGMIRESQNRIKAMALVHERMYRSEDISGIDLSDYVGFMATNLFRFYGIAPATVRLTVSISGIRVDINRAIPLGLVINELLSNALKHAFPEGRKGTVSVRGERDGDRIRVIVRDDGIGIPASLDWKNTDSLGLRLVNSLTDQMQGTIELDRADGTTFKITIPAEPEKQEPLAYGPAQKPGS